MFLSHLDKQPFDKDLTSIDLLRFQDVCSPNYVSVLKDCGETIDEDNFADIAKFFGDEV